MAAVIIDGKALAAKWKQDICQQVEQLSRRPSLAVILVGNNPASRVYVNGKERDCAECGILSQEYALPENVGQKALLELIDSLNRQEEVDGILCQLPLPRGFDYDEQEVLLSIDPRKDVDAFHPYNVGRIMIGDYTFLPCTPAGVMAMLDEYGIDPAGKQCVVVGRSNIVGKPMSMLLLHRHGTVTICHSRTPDLGKITREADILVCAVGKVGLITSDMVKQGACVIDVAMNRDENGKLCGDVEFASVREKAGWITPVPGGCGPMTRVMLLQNTLAAARSHGA